MSKKMLLKKFTAFFAVLLMIVSVLAPAEGVFADDHLSKHGYGGTWVGWQESSFKPTTSGYYCLEEDITLSDTWIVGGTSDIEVTLCLNGHTLRLAEGVTGKSVINIKAGSKLTICDCTGMGTVTGCNNSEGAGCIVVNGTLVLEGGTITGHYAHQGGGVDVGPAGVFIMNGGTISGNTASSMGAGVCVAGSGASFTMNGGKITGNRLDSDYAIGAGVYLQSGTLFTMNSGEISENMSNKSGSAGGGICVNYGTCIMNGGSIKSNKADSAGGVFLSGGSFTLNGGTIESNEAQEGGGILNQGTLTITGGEIKGNKAINGNAFGGGVYNYEDYSMTMSGGSISGNSAGLGGGVFLRGTLIIGGTAVISGNTVNNSDRPSNVWWGNNRNDYNLEQDDYLILGTKTTTEEGNGVPVPTTSMKVGVSLQYTPALSYDGYFYSDWPITRDDANLLTSDNIFPDDSGCGIIFRDDKVYLARSVFVIGDGKYTLEEAEAKQFISSSFLSQLEDVSFDGWYTQRTGGQLVSKDGETFEAPYTGFEKGPSYYAHWTYKDKPILTEPINFYDGKVSIGGEEVSEEILEQYNLSFDSSTLTLTADGAVMMVNIEPVYRDVATNYELPYAAAVNIYSEDDANASTFVMKGDTYIAYSGLSGVVNGCASGFGGGIYVGRNSTFIMESGTMQDNISYGETFGEKAGAGEGIFLDTGARAQMNGGTICYDIPMNEIPNPEYGGGVYISNGASFEMTGGSIEGYIAKYGGGVYVANGGSFTMKAGLIKDNIATDRGAGVYMNKDAYVSISGGKIVENGREGTGVGYGIYHEPAANFQDYQCLAAGTMITMADGSHRAIETLKVGDEVRVFDHETGTETTSKIYSIYEYPEYKTGAFTLHFTGDNNVTVIGGHLFYEQETNSYALIERTNAQEYVGYHFYNLDDHCWEVLEGVSYIDEPVRTLFIATEKQINCITDGMLSNEDGLFGIMCRIFEYDTDMKYDEAKKSADIEKYGLLDSSKAEYATSAGFEALNLKYLKIAIGKGLITAEELKEQGAYYSAKRQELSEAAATQNPDGSFTEEESVSAPVRKFMGGSTPGPASGLYLGGGAVISNNNNGDVFITDPLTIGTGDNGCAAPTDSMKVGIYLNTNNNIGAFTTNGQSGDEKYFFPHPMMKDGIYTKFVDNHLEFAKIPDGTHPIIIEYNEHGTVTADHQVAKHWDEVTLTATPDEGYMLGSYSVKDNSGSPESVPVTDGRFYMPKDYGVIVTATFLPLYDVTVTTPTNGTVTSDLSTAVEDQTVTLTVTPAEKARLKSLSVYKTGDPSTTVPVTQNTDNYTFTMPAYDVTVTALFEKIYTVSFDMNGHGTAITSLTEVVEGTKITLPTPDPVSGYEFKGWFKEAGCTTPWVADTDTVTADTTLFAKWYAPLPAPGPSPDPAPTPEPDPEPTPEPEPEPEEEPEEEKPAQDTETPDPLTLPVAEVKASINRGLVVNPSGKSAALTWGEIPGADGYIVYGAYCGSKKYEKLATIKDPEKTDFKVSKLGGKSINQNKNTKYYVVAYKLVDGKRVRITKSLLVRMVSKKNDTFTYPESVELEKSKFKLKEGKKATIKATTLLADDKKKLMSNIYGPEFRYASDNPEVATVSKNGKITAVGKGTCTIWVYSRNGNAVAVDVTVK